MPTPREIERFLDIAINKGEITEEQARCHYNEAKERNLEEREREWEGR